MTAKIIFLGTGPAGGTRSRMESSALIKFKKTNILIDVTRFFTKQKKFLKKIDAVLITHAHADAIGGLAKFNRWLKEKISLYGHTQTILKIKKKFKNLNQITFKSIRPYQTFKINNLEIFPLPVKHSIQKDFPTFGYFFKKFSLAYVSDTNGWNKKTENYLKKAKILVIDGAMWNKKMPAHLEIKSALKKIGHWPNKKIIFTQIGKSAPRQKFLEQEIKKICRKAKPAYDNLVLKL